MDLHFINPAIQEFIHSNLDKNTAALALQKNPFPEIEYSTLLHQIEAKNKAKLKLPTWFTTKNIVYPSKISLEQTSSEKTANYKAEIVSGNKLIDLSGGFGVDDFYFSKKVTEVTHCELNHSLSQIVQHNFEQLQVKNIQCIAGDSIDFLIQSNTLYDWIYIDPSRRNDTKGKVFMLKDCLPNIPKNLEILFQYSQKILIKTAPILDISAGIEELSHVKKIHIVAVENEVKELLWEIDKKYFDNPIIKTVNFKKETTETFAFTLNKNTIDVSYDLPEKYLYEPNSAIMKSGGFDAIGNEYNLKKLHKHSHLYTKDTIISFPGRIFEIETMFPFHKNDMKIHITGTQRNVTTRNFPETVADIRKKYKIKDGGNSYVFFTTDKNNHKIVLICKKINQ